MTWLSEVSRGRPKLYDAQRSGPSQALGEAPKGDRLVSSALVDLRLALLYIRPNVSALGL